MNDILNDDLAIRFHRKVADVSGFLLKNLENIKECCSNNNEFDDLIDNQTLIPLEYYLNVAPKQRSDLFYQSVQEFDILTGKVVGNAGGTLSINVQSVFQGQKRWISDLNIVAHARIPAHWDNENQIEIGEQVAGTLVYKDEESKEIRLSLENRSSLLCHVKSIHSDLAEDVYVRDNDSSDYSCVKNMKECCIFNNPQCIQILTKRVYINESQDSFLNKSNLHLKDSVDSLRDQQSYKWSMSMVGEGVKHFREKNLKEAWKCFDQAISFYPANVEGFVARGALKANRNDLQGAVKDFQEALKINPMHKNGKKYLVETSLSIARRYESNKKWKEASKSYREILTLEPEHKESKERCQQILQFLSNKILVGKEKPVLRNSSSGKQETSTVKHFSSSSSTSSSVSDSEQSSGNEWIEKKSSLKRKRRNNDRDIENLFNQSSFRNERTDSETGRIDKIMKIDESLHQKTNSFARKLKSFSSDDLQLVSKLLKKDSSQDGVDSKHRKIDVQCRQNDKHGSSASGSKKGKSCQDRNGPRSSRTSNKTSTALHSYYRKKDEDYTSKHKRRKDH